VTEKLTGSVYLQAFALVLFFLVLAPVNIAVAGQGARSDSAEDLIKGCTGEPVSQNILEKGGFIDIVSVSASVEGNSLILTLETEEPIPTRASNLASYSFVLDLDGDENTGFTGNRQPLGVFPKLGIDLWVNYSLYGDEKEDYGFPGSPGIPNLNERPNLVNTRTEKNGLVFSVSKSRIERVLTFAYAQFNPSWEIKPDKMEWAVLTNWAPLSSSNPASDVLPGSHYQPARRGCLTNPLVEETEEEVKEGKRKEKEDKEKKPPPPPSPPSPPS